MWLVDQVFSIGKDARNSLMVDHNGVEDFHIEIISDQDKLRLLNKAGGLGVWVNGLPISEETELNAGDQITIGELELELVDPKQNTPAIEVPTHSDWSIFSKASWLEKNRYTVEDKLIIGRDASCNIVLPLEHLSRQHVALEVRKGQLFVRDLDSANGTYLNGERVTEAPLKAGDKLKLDVVTFEVAGPTHDPHKTIIRTVSSPEKTKVKDRPTTTAQTAQPKQVVAAAKRNKSPEKKRLAANGKQDWIGKQGTGEQAKASKGGGLLIVGVILVLACAGLIISQL